MIDTKDMPREEAINYWVEKMGFTRTEAEFIVALERGENDGDLIDEGNKDD